MLRENKQPLANIFRIFDIIIIIVSFYISYALRFGFSGNKILDFTLEFVIFFTSYIIIWLFLSHKFHLYISKRHSSFKDEIFEVVKVVSLTLVISAIPAFYVRDFPLSRLFLIYFWPIQISLLILFRFILRSALKYIRRRGYNFRQVLIVGRNHRAKRIAQKIGDTPEYGLHILGFIDDDENNCKYKRKNEFRLLGNLNDFEKIMRNQVVDEVFITLPIKSYYSKIEEIVGICEKSGIEVEIPADLFDVKFAKTNIQKYDDIKFLEYYSSPEMNWKLVIKRLIDLVLSFVTLIFVAPLFLLVWILIKLTSKGPMFFKQKRVGYNGRSFTLLKFRTMVENAEGLKKSLLDKNEMDGPVFKIKDDPRITKIGHFLRKSSMDELPQLINVFMGDMSLVGPRPPTPDEVIKYKLTDRRRLSMRPGITCIWQVTGRNKVSFDEWMELDKLYIDNWSLWLDTKILIKTLFVVIKASGV